MGGIEGRSAPGWGPRASACAPRKAAGTPSALQHSVMGLPHKTVKVFRVVCMLTKLVVVCKVWPTWCTSRKN